MFQLPPLIYGNWQEACCHDRKPQPVWSVFVMVLPFPPPHAPRVLQFDWQLQTQGLFSYRGDNSTRTLKALTYGYGLRNDGHQQAAQTSNVDEDAWWTQQPGQTRGKEFDLSSHCHQQAANAAGRTLKFPNGLYGPVSVQASIKGASEAWLEQRDPLALTSAVPGTGGCSSSSPPVFNVSSTHVFFTEWEQRKPLKCAGVADLWFCLFLGLGQMFLTPIVQWFCWSSAPKSSPLGTNALRSKRSGMNQDSRHVGKHSWI